MILEYETKRLILMTPNKYYLNAILDYQIKNKDFLEKWEAERPQAFYTKKYQKYEIKLEQQALKKFLSACFMIIKKDEPEKIIGNIKLSNIIYGNFCSAQLGYRLDKDEINKGYMTEAVRKMLNIAFFDFNLHRVEASVIPTNEASRSVLKKAGFRYVGSSTSYLKINGDWREHEIYEYTDKFADMLCEE